MYPVTWTTAYCRPSLDGPSVLRRRARTGCDGDDIGSTAMSPRRIRMMKPRREPIHSLRFAVNHTNHSATTLQFYRLHSRGNNTFGSIHMCVCVSVRLSVSALLFEPFDSGASTLHIEPEWLTELRFNVPHSTKVRHFAHALSSQSLG